MAGNVGNSIQKLIHNTPVAVSVNDTTTTVATNGGAVYHAGLVNNRIQDSFREVIANENIVGHVVDVESTDNSVFLLNSAGSVFEYKYNAGECSPVVNEVYSPAVCHGDAAVKISTGSAHALILTECNKVFGVGSNCHYQIVPQGQCKYEIATEILVTDTNLHDNNCCTAFSGNLNELCEPVLPEIKKCNETECIKGSVCGKDAGILRISDVLLLSPGVSRSDTDPPSELGTIDFPVKIDYDYVGLLCRDHKDNLNGSVTVCVKRVYVPKIKCHENTSQFTFTNSDRNPVDVAYEICKESTLGALNPIVVCVSGKCGDTFCVPLSAILPTENDEGFSFNTENGSIILPSTGENVSNIGPVGYGFEGTSEGAVRGNVSIDTDIKIKLDCCPGTNKVCVSEPCPCPLPQPCWKSVYAGFNLSVLVDSCNRVYVLGSLHEVRSNKDLLKKSCLEQLLDKANASVSFPADQLNCCVTPRNGNCKCVVCKDRCFKTDLEKFGVHLNFNGYECEDKLGVCDFLKALKKCNEAPTCNNTCEPCDNYIYLNVAGGTECPCVGADGDIKKIILYNRKSVCRNVSAGDDKCAVQVDVTVNSLVEFDSNKYCVDALDICLDQTLILVFPGCEEGHTAVLYVDIDRPGGIQFTCGLEKANVEFSVDASSPSRQLILNYGSILDPVELTNLKRALCLDPYFPCPCYRNPFETKLINTYVKGGDRVRFVVCGSVGIRQAVTADVPTVFRLHRKVLDVGVGNNHLSLLVGGLKCPTEIFAIGNNCYGELGLQSHESVVCLKQVNRCFFDCQVTNIVSARNATFYITQSNRVYGSGQWKWLVDSNIPDHIDSICQSWKVRDIAVSNNHLVLLGADGNTYGLGDNSLGELGLCHTDCVRKFLPLIFFYKLNQCVTKQFLKSLAIPIFDKPALRNAFLEDTDIESRSAAGVRHSDWSASVRGKKYLPNGRSCSGSRYRY